MKRLFSVMTLFASPAVALSPIWCGAAEAVGEANGAATQVFGRGKPIDAAADGKAVAEPPALRSIAEKRRWLSDQLAAGVKDRRQLKQLQTRISKMTPQQVDVLTRAVLAQQLPAAEQQQQLQQGLQPFDQQQQQLLQQTNIELQRAQMIRQALENELWWRNAGYGVGVMPVITWLPQGTSFGAGATISPDGRYVRTAANPLFSSVGPVYTYNLNTGETRPWMPQSSYPANSQPLGYPAFNHANTYGGSWQQPRTAPQPQPRVWYDGIRTRVGN